MRASSLAKHRAKAEWLTTGDLARMVERTPRGARWIADQAHLDCQRTSSGQRLFRPRDVQRLADRRMEARRRGVNVLRPKRVGVPGEPHQLWLFGPTRVHQKKVRPQGEVPHADLLRK